ncbi:hypothetical protein HYC85_003263 [Camellia sinensis]|uniref:beta-galactosidase n=1 Tax=Camellia sinensis TaxID=4442 RepID=A0A7J7ICB6_CAMSI|nr:hypothetical protein HYC85_003263 [Camellia sinensis]
MVGTRRSWLQCLALVLTLQLSVIANEFFKPFNASRASGANGTNLWLPVDRPDDHPDDRLKHLSITTWPDLIAKSKEDGADVIQTYTFWNGHEPIRGQYNFEGRYDLVKFVKLVGSNGLYLHLRIGPYVRAEWNFGSHLHYFFFLNLLKNLKNPEIWICDYVSILSSK